ncbi:MAG: 7TM diverse intracellular signaling domain-containing protein [Sulfurimonas sp.]|nr:7TM diverse intracellular signaling domain-containing protein [Sulfurimonas sp.]
MRFFYKKFFGLMLAISPIFANTSIDVENLQTAQKLFGPWEMQPSHADNDTQKNFSKQSVKLPAFVESLVGTAKGAVIFTLELKTTSNQNLSLDLRQPFSVYRVYAEDELIGGSGEFDLQHGIYKAHASYPIVSFVPKNEKTTLKIYLANSEHNHLGFYGVPVIAPYGILEAQRKTNIDIQLMVAAVLFSFAIYHLGLFLAWRKDKAPFWFGLLSLALSIRAASTGEIVLMRFYPDISWEILFRTLYTSGYVALPLFVLYMGSLYPKQSNKVVENLYMFVGLLFVIFALFTSTEFFTSTLMTYELIVVTFIIYTLWVLFKSYKLKEKGSVLALGAFSVFSVTIVHDLLMFQNIIKDSKDLMPYGFIFYLLAQAMILLLRYADAFRTIELHTNNLEHLVADRTLKLQNLVEQRELLLRELTHRVKNNLQLILGLLWIQKKGADEKTINNLKTFEIQVKAISYVHEALCTQTKIDAIEINSYIRNVTESLQQLYPKLNIVFENQTQIYIKTDHAVSLGLILNELVTNYLKYSNTSHEQELLIETFQKSSKVHFKYKDGTNHQDGYQKVQESSFGLPKLGWPMIRKFLIQMDASITIVPEYLEIVFETGKTE